MILGITAATVAVGKVALSVGKLAFSGSKAIKVVPTGIVQNATSNMDEAAGTAGGGNSQPSFLFTQWVNRHTKMGRFIYAPAPN